MSLIEYDHADDAATIALKTAGNVVPWVGGAAIYAVAFAAFIVTGGGEHGASGTVSSRGAVTLTR